MKTRKIVPLIALAALVTACAAPIQAPILQQPKSGPCISPATARPIQVPTRPRSRPW